SRPLQSYTLFPYTTLFRSYLLDTLVLWQRELDRGELAPASLIHIERMKQYIQSHYRQRITKDVLADYIRRRPSYTASLFKKGTRSEEHTSELQSRENLVCR